MPCAFILIIFCLQIRVCICIIDLFEIIHQFIDSQDCRHFMHSTKFEQKYKDRTGSTFLPIVTIVLFHLHIFLNFYGYIELYLFSASLIFHILLALSDLCFFLFFQKTSKILLVLYFSVMKNDCCG